MQKLSQAIRARRLALGMSQQELASRVGYRSKSSVNKIELGERGLRPEQLETFALALSTTPAALMGYAEPVSAGEAEFLRLARLLTPGKPPRASCAARSACEKAIARRRFEGLSRRYAAASRPIAGGSSPSIFPFRSFFFKTIYLF
jgi:repressor LexA